MSPLSLNPLVYLVSVHCDINSLRITQIFTMGNNYAMIFFLKMLSSVSSRKSCTVFKTCNLLNSKIVTETVASMFCELPSEG